MAFNLKKKISVGVSISPEKGLEVAQIDFVNQIILKYINKPLAFDNIHKKVADLDIFKETLQEALSELNIPKGSEIVLSLPTIFFNVEDFSAAKSEQEIINEIEERLSSHSLFEETEPVVSHIRLPISTMQFHKIASVASQKVMLIEIAMQIKEMGYKVIGFDTSVSSILNALIYTNRVDISPERSWVLLFVDNSCCRIVSMQGSSYVDCYEEPISIGEVLGDEENYSIVTNAIVPILKNLPSQCLYVISKTNAISAKVLADNLVYNAPIIHQEANFFNSDPFLMYSDNIDENSAKQISLDVIGAAIYRDFANLYPLQFNFFNASLGDVYLLEQPPIIPVGKYLLTLSMENMLLAAAAVFVLIVVITLFMIIPLNSSIAQKEKEQKDLDLNIALVQKYLDQNKGVSTNTFDEGDEIRMGLVHNKGIYSYYSIVGTEIPKKLWLTSLDLGKSISIEGQADNLESVYSFFRNIRDYNPSAGFKLQKLALSTNAKMTPLSEEEAFETNSSITFSTADFYEFKISNAVEETSDSSKEKKTAKSSEKKSKSPNNLGPLD